MIRLALSATAVAFVVTFVLFSEAGHARANEGQTVALSPMLQVSRLHEVARGPSVGREAPSVHVPVPVPTPHALVMHGACCDPQNTCERLAAALPQGVELQCASGNFECVGGGFDWRGDGEDKAAHIEQLLPTRTAESSSNGDNLLVGFSRGAFVARDVALARPGRYSALVLIGASITLDVPALKAAGIRRVVLAAGEYDSSFKAMKRARDKLALNGIEARFVPLGKVFHELPADAGPRLREAVAWASELPRA